MYTATRNADSLIMQKTIKYGLQLGSQQYRQNPTLSMELRVESTKIAKTHYRGSGEVVSTVLPLLAQLDCYVQPLFSSLVPRPMRGMFCMWTMLCLAWITLSMILAVLMSGDVCGNWNEPKFAPPNNYGPAFGRS